MTAMDFTRRLKTSKGQAVRILCTDRVCPVGFSVVALVRNARAMFGDEEFVVVYKPDGSPSDNGHGQLVYADD